jgi:acyl dehydratase
MPQATITPEMMASMRARAGQVLRIDHSVSNEEVTRLAIIRFCEGIGDPNPLWCDPEHAGRGPFGTQVGPPSWVICAFAGLQFGWPGLGSFHCGSELEFHSPVCVGDVIRAECTYEGFDGPKPARFAERVVIDHFTNRYHNQSGALVATIRWSVLNFERGRIREQPREQAATVLPHRWTEAELLALEAEVRAERPRGPVPRWWDDVDVGQPLTTVVKGPIGMTDEIAYVAAGGAPIPRLAAHRSALQSYDRHPAWSFRDPVSAALEPIYAVHYNKSAAQAMGVPLQYDVGFQRQCWQVHLLTDWLGDDGWLLACDAEYRAFVYHGDVVRLGGQVVEKLVDERGEAVIDVQTNAINQRGLNVMPGHARIALPRRDEADSPARRRARATGRLRGGRSRTMTSPCGGRAASTDIPGPEGGMR